MKHGHFITALFTADDWVELSIHCLRVSTAECATYW